MYTTIYCVRAPGHPLNMLHPSFESGFSWYHISSSCFYVSDAASIFLVDHRSPQEVTKSPPFRTPKLPVSKLIFSCPVDTRDNTVCGPELWLLTPKPRRT